MGQTVVQCWFIVVLQKQLSVHGTNAWSGLAGVGLYIAVLHAGVCESRAARGVLPMLPSLGAKVQTGSYCGVYISSHQKGRTSSRLHNGCVIARMTTRCEVQRNGLHDRRHCTEVCSLLHCVNFTVRTTTPHWLTLASLPATYHSGMLELLLDNTRNSICLARQSTCSSSFLSHAVQCTNGFLAGYAQVGGMAWLTGQLTELSVQLND